MDTAESENETTNIGDHHENKPEDLPFITDSQTLWRWKGGDQGCLTVRREKWDRVLPKCGVSAQRRDGGGVTARSFMDGLEVIHAVLAALLGKASVCLQRRAAFVI